MSVAAKFKSWRQGRRIKARARPRKQEPDSSATRRFNGRNMPLPMDADEAYFPSDLRQGRQSDLPD